MAGQNPGLRQQVDSASRFENVVVLSESESVYDAEAGLQGGTNRSRDDTVGATRSQDTRPSFRVSVER
jgi:hypothetical protein